MKRFSESFVTGAAWGVIASAGITLARWLTWEPYSPMIIPYDIVICAFGFGLLLAVARSIMAAKGSEGYWGAFVSAALLMFFGTVFYGELYGTGGGPTLKILHGVALLGVAAIFIRHALSNRTGVVRFEWLCVVLGVAFAVGLKGYAYWKAFSLVFPIVVALSMARGIPVAKISPGRNLLLPLTVTGLLMGVCYFSVAPGSGQLAHAKTTAGAKSGNSVILIVLDTLRRDHLSLYGYHRQTTPNLDKWAEGAMVFEDMTTTSSWTLPTHASMFTGLYPRSHGAHGFRKVGTWGNTYKLSESKTTIAELASQNGITTGAIIANHFYLSPKFGSDQGFMSYWVKRPKRGITVYPTDWLAKTFDPHGYADFDWAYYRDRYITDNALKWLRKSGAGQFFLFLNYMDTHAPNWRASNGVVPLEDEASLDEQSESNLHHILQGERLSARIKAGLVNNYDRELMHLDEDIKRLLDYLQSSGLEKTTTVIVTSDHGEYFGEHNLISRSKHLHNEVVNVPLFIKGPGIPSGRSSKPVQSVDVFPTILDLLGVRYRGEQIQGVSVLDKKEHEIVSEWYASENGHFLEDRFNGRFDRDLRTIRHDNLKLFEDNRGRVELYDLASDPGEERNLASGRKDTLEKIRLLLNKWLDKHPKAKTVKSKELQMSPDEVEKIKALGYVN